MNEILQTVFGLLGGLAINPVMGVLAGALTTAVLQSSSATIAVLQNFASQDGPDGVTSIMGLAGAIPVLLVIISELQSLRLLHVSDSQEMQRERRLLTVRSIFPVRCCSYGSPSHMHSSSR